MTSLPYPSFNQIQPVSVDRIKQAIVTAYQEPNPYGFGDSLKVDSQRISTAADNARKNGDTNLASALDNLSKALKVNLNQIDSNGDGLLEIQKFLYYTDTPLDTELENFAHIGGRFDQVDNPDFVRTIGPNPSPPATSFKSFRITSLDQIKTALDQANVALNGPQPVDGGTRVSSQVIQYAANQARNNGNQNLATALDNLDLALRTNYRNVDKNGDHKLETEVGFVISPDGSIPKSELEILATKGLNQYDSQLDKSDFGLNPSPYPPQPLPYPGGNPGNSFQKTLLALLFFFMSKIGGGNNGFFPY